MRVGKFKEYYVGNVCRLGHYRSNAVAGVENNGGEEIYQQKSKNI
jgi:hypothetical protein